jgi:hypothetical protein
MSIRSALALVLGAASLAAQTVIYIPDSNPATGGGPNTIPWGQTGGYTSLHVYHADQLRAGGACAGSTLVDFAIISTSTTGGTYSCATARLQVGHLLVYPPVQGNWGGHLVAPVTIWDTAVQGPFTFPWTGNSWNPLPGFSAGGFVWDGVSDVGLLYTHTGATGTFSTRTMMNMRHGTTTYNATTQLPTTTGMFATKARLTFIGGTPGYQLSQPAASFDLDGVTGQPCLPSTARKCSGTTTTANFASTLAGNGWEFAFTAGDLLLPLGGGGLLLPASGQILNLNLASPGLILLNGFAFPPFPGNFALPVSAPAPLQIGAQMVILNPASPDGLAVSGGANLVYAEGGSQNVPYTASTSVTYNLGVPPLCGPSSVNFYGVSYTQIFVTDNGRVMFGSGSTSGSPTIASAMANPGFVGHWCDLDPRIGGYIDVSTTATTVRVDFVGVPYASQAAYPNTFGIVIDAPTGVITMDGLGGIVAHPTTLNGFFGISRGAGATNPGTTAFSPPSSNVTGNATDMIYNFGLAGTHATGLSSITFLPNASSNYDWISL